jgi:uncharacterized protein
VEELLAYLARQLVAHPDEVRVTTREGEAGELVLELRVAEDDRGRVIGKGGRVARSLRTVVRAAAAGEGRRVHVDITT